MAISSKDYIKAYLRFIVEDHGSLKQLKPILEDCIKQARVKTKFFGLVDSDDGNPLTEDDTYISFQFDKITDSEIGRLQRVLLKRFGECNTRIIQTRK